MIVLVGFMGAGKSTVGRLLAGRLGLPFVDADERIEARAGRAVADIFAEAGEAAFRDIEEQVVADLLAGPDAVLALGGGALGRPGTRAALASDRHTVVYLHVDWDEALRRVGDDPGRPMLRNPDVASLYEARLTEYAECASLIVPTSGRLVQEVADEVAAHVGPVERAAVDQVGSVWIGRGILPRAAELVPQAAEQTMVLHTASGAGYASEVAAAIRATGRTVHLLQVPDAEASKTAQVAAQCWQALGRAGFTRTDAVVGVGGGAVTDLAGFVAATWLRGVPVVQVPTTLLAMVDAAVGGKTGINTGEGKNLVGCFHEPVGVVCDLDVLATLPRADLRAGLAEVVKAGFIADPVIVDLMERHPSPGAADPVLRELVTRAIQVKVDVVAADLRESWLREILNYGHTFGHAIELVEGYRWRHGEAVAVGMRYASALGRLAGITPAAVVERQHGVLTALGLPTTYRGDRWPDLLAAMRRDKKSRGATLRFVVLEDLGRPTRLAGPPEEQMLAAYREIAG